MSTDRVLTPRGAPCMAPHRIALLAKMNKSGVENKDQCDSGFQEDSFKSQGGSFERESSELRCIEEATKNITIEDDSMLHDYERHSKAFAPEPKESLASVNPATSQSLSPESCVLNFAQCNDVRYLLAPMRHCLFVQDEDGDTPLHLAIIHMKMQVVEAIVAVAPCPQALDIFNYLRQTPLHLATITKQPVIVRGLIAAGASVDLVDRNGKTALHLACERGDIDCLREIIRPLTDKAANEETRERVYDMLNARDYQGFTALQLAVFANSVSAVSTLTSIGADVNVPDARSGKTALHHAVEAENLGMASYLVFQCNAEVDAMTFDECTPLHFAAGRGLAPMTGLLLAVGADPTNMNRSGASPQDEAAYNVRPMLELPQAPPF